jgi:hypothetical protein
LWKALPTTDTCNRYQYHGEIVWLIKIEDSKEVRERCIRLSVRIVKRSAKFLSNPGKIVRCIAGTVFPSTKIAVVKRKFISWLGARLVIGRNILIHLAVNRRLWRWNSNRLCRYGMI